MHRVSIIAVAMLAMSLHSCVSPEAHRQLIAANEALRGQIGDLEAYHRQLEEENRRLGGEVDRLGRNAVDAAHLRQQKEELARLIEQFQNGGGRNLQGVTVRETAEGVVFELQGEVLFSSGQATITESGQGVLGQLVPILREHRHAVRIDGHTDSDPIRRSQWRTNLRLSAERSIAVVEYLISSGVDPAQLHVSAFGEHRPAVAGTDDASKSRNRRVEIMMLRQ